MSTVRVGTKKGAKGTSPSSLVDRAKDWLERRGNLSRLRGLESQGLPAELHAPLAWLVNGQSDAAADEVARKIESIRAEIPAQVGNSVPIWYSPKPGSAGDAVSEGLRPEPGKTLEFPVERIVAMGNARRGRFLYLLARGTKARTVVELGACAGIASCYMASGESVSRLVTVEGSPDLARLAAHNLGQIGKNASVINKRFDDAITEDAAAIGSPIDLLLIDGHHEKIATIHYFERMRPFLADRSWVVFDDISWSQDMRDAWNELVKAPGVTHALDIGFLGACLVERGFAGAGRVWDLQPLTGRVPIREPHGWKE